MFVKVLYADNVTPLSAGTFNELQDRIEDAFADVGVYTGEVPFFVQPTQPTYADGPYAWFDTAGFTLWIEDGV